MTPRAEIVCADAQLLYRAPGNSFQPVTSIYILQENRPGRKFGFHLIGDYRRRSPLLHQNRFQIGHSLIFADQGHIIETIHQIKPPKRFGRRFHGNKKIGIAQRPGLQETRPTSISLTIPDFGQHFTSGIRDFGHYPLGFTASLIDIYNHEATAARRTVMPGHNPDHCRRPSRNRTCIEIRSREIGVGTVISTLVRTVRIHRESNTRIGMWQIGIFPALIQDHAVFHHHRSPIAILIVCQLPGFAGRRIITEQSAHVAASIGARQTEECPGRTEYVAAVRRITSFERIKITICFRCQLA